MHEGLQHADVRNFIGDRFVESSGKAFYDIYDPSTGRVIGRVRETPREEVREAIESSRDAFDTWKKVPVTERIGYLFRLEGLMREHADELARIITIEHGKTLSESKAEVWRAIENVRSACASTYHMMGKNNMDVSHGVDEELIRVPVGVFSVICPFNFPLMVPFWFIPYAVGLGNTVLVKPSEKVPLTMQKAAELIRDAGFPPGVVNIVNGAKEAVNEIIENRNISGISFVGSTPVGEQIYRRGTANRKRVQAGTSAKNYELVMPDADLDAAILSLVSSFFGNTGQRCLAGSVVVTLEENHDEVLRRLVSSAKELRIGSGLQKDVTMGPMNREDGRTRVLSYVEAGVSEGAELVLDGSGMRPVEEELRNGFFVGPSVFDRVSDDMKILREEIFGPVASVICVGSLDEAIERINRSRFGNSSTIFTRSGENARKFIDQVQVGNFGVNVGVAAPIAFYPFGGMKDSFFGDLHAQGGDDHIYFFTERKVVISRW